MPLKLYFAPGSCSFVPHTLLETAGASYETQFVNLRKGEHQEAAYKAINPHAQVPALANGAQVITQVVAIVVYVDALFPEQGFLPREALARAKVLETLVWMNSTAHPTFSHVFSPQKFSDDAAVRENLRAYNLPLYRGMLGEVEALARLAQARGQGWLGGERFGPLDGYAVTLLRWGRWVGIEPQDFPALYGLAQRTAVLPAVARVVDRERLPLF